MVNPVVHFIVLSVLSFLRSCDFYSDFKFFLVHQLYWFWFFG